MVTALVVVQVRWAALAPQRKECSETKLTEYYKSADFEIQFCQLCRGSRLENMLQPELRRGPHALLCSKQELVVVEKVGEL